jgi:transcriptional regulator with XRE-family HTH domain
MLLNIGDLVKNRRLELGLTQAQVAEGICSRETINQLEHNKTLPRLFVIDKVLDKLTIDGDTLLTLPSSRQDIYSLKKQSEIHRHMYNTEKFPAEGGKNLREALEALSNDMDIDESYKSFLLDFGYTHLYIYSEADQNLELGEARAIAFLRKYRPDFDFSELHTYYLTSYELNVISRLSCLYRLKNEPATAVYILEAIKTFQEEKQLDKDLRGFRPIFISTIMHLADTYLVSCRFEETLALTNAYYPHLKEHDSLRLVMKILYVNCLALLNLGRKDEGTEIFNKISLLHSTVDNLFIQLDPQRPDISEWIAYVKKTWGI